MKKIVLSMLLVCVSALCLANPVSEKKAHQVAFNFLNKRANTSFNEMKLVHSQRFPSGEDTAYYVYSVGNSSFVIVAGDDIAKPIWGYSFDNGFSDKVPENVKGFLDDLVNELQAARKQGVRCDRNTQRSWTELMENNTIAIASINNTISETNPSSQSTAGSSVAPLITTHWDQESPYDYLCRPQGSASPQGDVGCGAVAVAQILRYWQYPEYPRGMHTNPKNSTPLSIDFDSVTFNYALMPNAITSSSAYTNIYEVSRLLFFCGIAMDMKFTDGSSHYSAPLSVLVNYFRFSPSIGMANKNAYDDSIWIDMLRNELDAGRPMIYRGGGTTTGANHIFICDGYTESDMFHFNMGHGGSGDGYYLLSTITGSTQSGSTLYYKYNQLAIMGITPDTNSHTIITQKWGTSKYIVSDTIDVYKQRSLLLINGYTFTAWGDDHNNHIMLFVPEDSTKQLKIELLSSDNSRVRVYDGMNLDSILDGSNNYTMHPADYPMYSSRHALSLKDTSIMNAYNYSFRITVDNECKKVTGLSHRINGDTLQLSWNENGNASNWQVEYGPTGFLHGEGTLINIDTTICNITGLTGNRQYDFYVRAACGDSSYSEWEIERIIAPPSGGFTYWKDVVTTQPEGYQIGADGNIYIYSSEGLAWLISTCNGLNGQSSYSISNKSVFLMDDVDMSDHLWTPLTQIKKFDGRNHTISGIVISNTNSTYQMNIGFIETIGGWDTVMNILFQNCLILCQNGHYVGCIAGRCNGLIVNCGATGSITTSGSNVGGLTGTLFYGELVNSYSNVSIIGNNYLGGAIGHGGYNSSSQNRIANSYSSGSVSGNYPYSDPSIGAFIGYANEANGIDYLAYWFQQDTVLSGCGNNIAGFSPFVISSEIDTIIAITDDWNNVIGYQTIYDTALSLVTPTTIGGQNVSTLVDALNAWVDSNNSNGQYRRWTNDTDNINHGFPVFDVTRYSVSLLCDSSMGSVSGSGNYAEDSQITISANANNCYHFTQWSDGNTNSTRTITVTQGISLTAIFAPDAPAMGNVVATECDQYSWKGNTYTTSGTYTFDTLTASGCDSIVSLSLTINHSDLTGSISITACNEYNWHGTTYYNSGVYTYSTTTTLGCDSLVTLNLTIGNEIVTIDSAVACDYYAWNGLSYNNSGVYADTMSTVSGCDSILVLNLTLNHSDTVGSETIVACDSYAWKGNTYSESGIYTFDSLTTNGCDSTVTLFLTINNSDLSGTENITTCDNFYTWNGTTYNSSGTYTHNTTTLTGCDSLVTLTLTIGESYAIHDTATACNSYIWNGTVYNSSGNYENNYSTPLGCDSTLFLHLTINHSVTNDTSVSACDSIIWNGITYIESGDYVFEMETAEGCDSIVTLYLTVNHPVHTSTTEVACDSLDWYENKYYQSGTYYRNTVDDNGCTQIDTLYLTINHSTSSNFTIVITENSLPYNFNGIIITESGEFTIKLTNAEGCDSNVFINVIVEPVSIEITDDSSDISIFPNPTNGNMTVSSDQAISLIEIYDAVGRMVGSKTNANIINLSGLPNGTYTMKIVTHESQCIKKIIKH